MPVSTLAPTTITAPEPVRRVYRVGFPPETFDEMIARVRANAPSWPVDGNGWNHVTGTWEPEATFEEQMARLREAATGEALLQFPPPTPDPDPEARVAAWDGVEARVAQMAKDGDLTQVDHLLGQVAGQTAFLRQVLAELKRLRSEALTAIVAACDEHEEWNDYEYEFTKDKLTERRLWEAFDPSDDLLAAYVDRRK